MAVLNDTARPVASRAEGDALALAAHAARLGQLVEVNWLFGYVGDDSVEWHSDPPFVVRVEATDRESLTRVCDQFIDPYWNVSVVEDRGIPAVATASSHWIHGPSYEMPVGHRK